MHVYPVIFTTVKRLNFLRAVVFACTQSCGASVCHYGLYLCTFVLLCICVGTACVCPGVGPLGPSVGGIESYDRAGGHRM